MKEGAFVITILKAILYTVLLLFFLFLPVGGLHLVVFFIIYVCPILIPLLLVLWLFSEKKEPTSVNENHSVIYTGAVSGTPEFAMSEITRSIQEQDGELFLQFVDVDGILTDVEKKIPGMWAAQLKQQLLPRRPAGAFCIAEFAHYPAENFHGPFFLTGLSQRSEQTGKNSGRTCNMLRV